VDTSEQVAIETTSQVKGRWRSVEEKRRIVEEALEAEASVARRHAVSVRESKAADQRTYRRCGAEVRPELDLG
jgi:hypothetical protein